MASTDIRRDINTSYGMDGHIYTNSGKTMMATGIQTDICEKRGNRPGV